MIDWKTRVNPYQRMYSLRNSLALVAFYTAGLVVSWVVDSGISGWWDGLWVGLWLAWVFQYSVQLLGVWLELRRKQREVSVPKDIPKVDLS